MSLLHSYLAETVEKNANGRLQAEMRVHDLEQQLKEANKVVDLFKNHLEICLIFVYDENGCTCGFEKRNEYLEKYKAVSDE
jgi:hypothetical protein